MSKLKVVVIGRHYGANTVVRRVLSYEGTEVEQIDGGGKGRFPDCDLAIVCIRVVSHAIYYAARDHYKAAGTPAIYIESGWSEVVHDFENWLQKSRGFVQRVNPDAAVRAASASMGNPETAMAKALAKAAAHVEAKPEPPPPAEESRGSKAYPKTFNAKRAEVIFASLKAGMSNKEIAFTLAQQKIRKNNGSSMTTGEVAAYIIRHELRTYDDLGQWPSYARHVGVEPDPLPTPAPLPSGQPDAPVTPPPPEPVPVVEPSAHAPPVDPPVAVASPVPDTRTHGERMHELIGKVLASQKLDVARKLELVEEIHAGVRTTDRQIIVERLGGNLQLTEQSIFEPGDRALVTLDKSQAIAIIEHLNQVKAFADEP